MPTFQVMSLDEWTVEDWATALRQGHVEEVEARNDEAAAILGAEFDSLDDGRKASVLVVAKTDPPATEGRTYCVRQRVRVDYEVGDVDDVTLPSGDVADAEEA